ncbi:MAG: PBP1A family penicillin-binding protein [Candidatus Taylorbacteria bacterium]|nr:PBP1A family penicillin-binding protein [Candidatus Taylorbacteria bacterium]
MKNFFRKAIQIIDRISSVIEWQIHKTFKTVKKAKKKKHFFRDTILIFFAIAIFFISGFILWAATLKTPDLTSFDDRLLGQSAKIYDRTGKVLLYDLSQRVRRTVVPFDEISPYIKKATIAIEDIDFYNHKGIKATSIIRAVIANITTLRFSQGGSTITQQVVKNSLLTKDKDISRKLKEWILAVKLERTTDKDSILNLYLNDSPYGGNIYGIEEASQVFFAKKSSDVTLAEAAYLAALPQAPSLYSPYGKNLKALVDRKNLVLKKMYENRLITEEEYSKALEENVIFQPKTVGGIKAPHFVMYVKDYLEQKYGEKMLAEGGFSVVTTLDWEMQQKAEEIVGRYVKDNQKKFNASNGSLVAIDPNTGGILAMVGSRDYFDKEIDGNFNTATSRRQPGSAFKPFVYATAFSKGFTPDTPTYDVPTEFNASCGTDGKPLSGDAKCYSPQNYEGGYKGLMSLRKALAESRNIPAVRLLHLVGVSDSIKTAEVMGIQNLTSAEQYGLSLALGGGEVSLLDMTSAYGVFANNGEREKSNAILEIKTSEGVEIEKFKANPKQVIPTQTAQLMNDVLADPYARAPIFGSRYFGDRQVAIKTGTTNSSRDAWVIGYTPSISVGAWMGNNNNTPMVQQASARIIGPMWKEFMDWVLTKIPDETFELPEPTSSSVKPFLRGVWQGPGNEVHSELYWINKADPQGEAPGYSSRDSLFKNFEAGVQNWAYTQGYALISNMNIVNNAVGFRIVNPVPNSSVGANERVTISVSGTSAQTSQVEYHINGTLIGKSTESPFSFSFIPSSTQGIDPENELKAVMIDRLGKYTESKIFFSVSQ